VLRNTLCLLMALVLASGPLAAQTQDSEVTKGIRQVDEGDYDAAIVTLDAAARRLAADKTKVKDLSQAYLYLGIAYVGKGHEAAAKAKFRDAVAQIKDLSLSADRYPPKVINLFEAAKEEARAAGTATTSAGTTRPPATAAPTPAAAAPEQGGGGGGKKLLLIGGGVAVAGAGAYLAFGKSDDGGCDTYFRDASGILNSSQQSFALVTTPADDGAWHAELTFTVTAAEAAKSRGALPPTVFLFAVNNSTNQDVAQEQLTGANTKRIEWQGTSGTLYRIGVELQDASAANYQLVVSGPCLF
jgi:tetratricopeptide (TPR) repeat protein